MTNNENEAATKRYSDLLAGALAEIETISGGSYAYLEWFHANTPKMYQQLEGFADAVERALNVLPLPCFETLMGVYVAGHRHLFAMWTARDQLALLKMTPGNFLVM